MRNSAEKHRGFTQRYTKIVRLSDPEARKDFICWSEIISQRRRGAKFYFFNRMVELSKGVVRLSGVEASGAKFFLICVQL